MKIIHCADLHLDSKMESYLTKEQAKERRAEILMTYCEIVDYANKNGVSVIMISGDMFDTNKVTKRTANVVLDTIKSNPHIDFLYLRGNHDAKSLPAEFGKETVDETRPANLKLFDENWTQYAYDNVVISGTELTENNMDYIYDALVLEPSKYNIVMLHGQESKYKGKDKTPIVNLSKLKNRNIDYLALGHIHTYKEGKIDNRGTYCYSGCPEGRGFDECGQKGFLLLEIREGGMSKTFIPMGKRTLHEVPVDISGLRTSSEVAGEIQKAVATISFEDLVKVILRGEIPVDGSSMETELDLSYLERLCKEHFYFLKIVDETTLAINLEKLRYDVSLKGEFLRQVFADKKMSDKDKERVSMLGVKALAGEELNL